MTRADAAEKAAKLLRLARGSSCVPEAENARRQAGKIMSEYGITKEELDAGDRAAAFDELVGNLEEYVSSKSGIPTGLFDQSSAIRDVLTKIKSLPATDKSKRLGQAVTLINFANLVAGDTPVVRDVKNIVEQTIAKHAK